RGRALVRRRVRGCARADAQVPRPGLGCGGGHRQDGADQSRAIGGSQLMKKPGRSRPLARACPRNRDAELSQGLKTSNGREYTRILLLLAFIRVHSRFKSVLLGQALARACPKTVVANFWRKLLSPGSPALGRSSTRVSAQSFRRETAER